MEKILTCVDCLATFVFTDAEQEFFLHHGLANEPKRCAACRARRRQESRRARHLAPTPIRCAECGRPDTVPFVPRSPEGLLCRGCLWKRRQEAARDAAGDPRGRVTGSLT